MMRAILAIGVMMITPAFADDTAKTFLNDAATSRCTVIERLAHGDNAGAIRLLAMMQVSVRYLWHKPITMQPIITDENKMIELLDNEITACEQDRSQTVLQTVQQALER